MSDVVSREVMAFLTFLNVLKDQSLLQAFRESAE